MSSKQIKTALSSKGYPVKNVEYIRNAATPSGYGKGYDIEFTDVNDSFVEFEDLVFEFNPELQIDSFMEFDDLSEVMEWVKSLPNLKQLRKGGRDE